MPQLPHHRGPAHSTEARVAAFKAAHRTKLQATNPIERLNGEMKRRTEVIGIFPNEDAVIRFEG